MTGETPLTMTADEIGILGQSEDEKEACRLRGERLRGVAAALGVEPDAPDGQSGPARQSFVLLVDDQGNHYSWLRMVEAHVALMNGGE